MKKVPLAFVLSMVFMLTLAGCGNTRPSDKEAPADLPQAAAAAHSDPAAGSGRLVGERFEDVIILEGMETPVHYEHIRNGMPGFEMDYDYENFVRHSETDREWFVSCWDDPAHPENYLEVRYSPLDAEAAAEAIVDTLSHDYEINRDDSFSLERAGRCIRIVADEVKGGGYMPDHLQTVYIIPADDGCRVATAHCEIVESEGFLRRFRYMMNTFSAVTSSGSHSIPGAWQTASVSFADDGTMQPAYYVMFSETAILYGHLISGQFVLDHTDEIVSVTEISAEGIRVQAESSSGVQYTYQTSESDDAVLEYYETLREEEFPERYSGSASLSRCTQ